jgi:tetratricopeptide (TPR) repeat protein
LLLAQRLRSDLGARSRRPHGHHRRQPLQRVPRQALRDELLDPKIAEHRGRIVKTTGDGLSDEEVAEGVRLARQALETGREDPDTVSWAAITLLVFAGEAAMAESVIDRVVTRNPNSATAWMASGSIRAFRNQPKAAIDAFGRALRLSPFDPLGHLVAGGLALAHLAARRLEQAIEWADRALHDQPR